MMTITTQTSTIRYLLAFILLNALALLYSYQLFLNLVFASTSAMLVIFFSFKSHHAMVQKRLENYDSSVDRDSIDKLEDPFDLYGEEQSTDANLNIKEYIKAHKKENKIKALSAVKNGSGAYFSIYRLLAYAFLVLSFIGLKNNAYLHVGFFMAGVTVGIGFGYQVAKSFFATKREV
jgi:hypothetical protein